MPDWLFKLPLNQIDKVSREHALPTNLVAAICSVESGGNSLAVRFEPGWIYFLTPEIFANSLGISFQTEKNCQAISWGLMQVMGTVARELKHTGHLTELCTIEIGLKYGCLKIKLLLNKYPLEDAISAYNCGTPKRVNGKYTNEIYVNKVMSKIMELNK